MSFLFFFSLSVAKNVFNMDPARIYGTRHKNVVVRPIPADSDDSELSSEAEDDETYELDNSPDIGKI